MLWAEPTDVEAFVAIDSDDAKPIRMSLSENHARKLKAALRANP